MDVEERSVQSCSEDMMEMSEAGEEVLAVSRSSAADSAFDAAVGCIEGVVMEEEFHQLQLSFMERHYLEFDSVDENKLNYTPIFNEYVDLLENHLEQRLTESIPGFSMNAFIEQLTQHKDEVSGDIFDMLLTFTDFMAFKSMFLDYRAEKEGRGLDLSDALVVTSLVPAGSGLSCPTEPQRHT